MTASNGLAIFETLAADVHRRLGASGATGLPDAASEALRAARLHEQLTHEDILRWAVESPDLPTQHVHSRFGQPPLTVYRDEDLYIEVLTWLDGTTTIHQHAFAGAFCVLEGSSCHTRYDFHATEQPCDTLQFGELSYRGVEFLEQGACRPIPPGAGLIHALFHIERPSVSVVVRTDRLGEHLPQWAYQPPGLAHVPQDSPEAVQRRVDVLQAQAHLAYDDGHEALCRRLQTADLAEAWSLLSAVWATARATPSADTLLDRVGARHPEAGRLFREALEAQHRSRSLAARRELVRAPEDRWLMAILLNVPERSDVLSLIAARHPSQDPVDWLMERLVALGDQPAPEEFGGSALGLVLDDLGTALCTGLLRGEPRDAVIERLARREDATDADASWLAGVDQMLRKSHVLGRLLG